MTSRFEKFSESARRVLSLAQEEAQRFNHNYIGTEHILLGIVRESEGVAAKVLSKLVRKTKVSKPARAPTEQELLSELRTLQHKAMQSRDSKSQRLIRGKISDLLALKFPKCKELATQLRTLKKRKLNFTPRSRDKKQQMTSLLGEIRVAVDESAAAVEKYQKFLKRPV